VISGFLITTILSEELRDAGRIRLERFYFRRTLRIFVPYYAFLGVVALLDAGGVVLIPSDDLVAAATYTTNYDLHAARQLTHTWSLAVEEQFYLLWPGVLVLLGRRRALVAAAAVILCAPLIRVVEWRLWPAASAGIGHRFETCADALAMGCLLAGARAWLATRPRYATALRSRALVAIVSGLVLAMVGFDTHPRAAFAITWSAQNLGIAFVIDHCLRHSERGLGAWLSKRPIVTIGRMSYSIYLWQQLFLDRTSAAALSAFPVNLVADAVCATASYYGVEATAMALRQVLEPRLFRRQAAVSTIGAPGQAV